MICAPVRIADAPGILNRFQVIDAAVLTGITGACLANNFANMCNGANLAYRKSVFLEVGGFSENNKHPGGDDMFLMHQVAKRYPGSVRFVKSFDAMASTNPQPGFSSFRDQRVRWLSKSARLTDKWITLHLVVAYLFNFALLASLLAGVFFSQQFLLLGCLMLLLKLALELPFVYWSLEFTRQQALIVWFIPVQMLHILYVVIFGLLGIFTSYHWKGRKYVANTLARGMGSDG